MNLLLVLSLLSLIITIFGAITSPRRDLKFLDLAKYDGYTAEEHFVTTEDGYILGVFRMPLQKNCTVNKGPIIFMHALFVSGDDCLIPGPGKAHCYIYSDNCYDIWIPNIRGTLYSRNHTYYDPDKDSEFWDYTFDEMSIYDLPAIIDYVLETTNNTQVSYVGHGQGVTVLLILCSKKPEYNSKIKVGFGLSVAAWLDHARFPVFQIEALIEPLLTLGGSTLNKEILTRGGIVNIAGKTLCGLSTLSYPFCSNIIFAFVGYNQYQITSDVLPVVYGHLPSGTSLKNLNRYGQIINNGFTEYDYGSAKNLIKYKSVDPPVYDVNKITMKWILVASENDYVGNVTDVKYLVSKLSNVKLHILSDKTFGHLDFIYGKDIKNYITPIVLSVLENGTIVDT